MRGRGKSPSSDKGYRGEWVLNLCLKVSSKKKIPSHDSPRSMEFLDAKREGPHSRIVPSSLALAKIVGSFGFHETQFTMFV